MHIYRHLRFDQMIFHQRKFQCQSYRFVLCIRSRFYPRDCTWCLLLHRIVRNERILLERCLYHISNRNIPHICKSFYYIRQILTLLLNILDKSSNICLRKAMFLPKWPILPSILSLTLKHQPQFIRQLLSSIITFHDTLSYTANKT